MADASAPATTATQRPEDKVGIFLSHKSEDAVAAKEIKHILAKLAGARADVFLSSEDIEFGDDWRRWISRSLAKSKILLLLFTDPRATWDWCLFEAGLFLHNEFLIDPVQEGLRRVVCLHRPEIERPRPLSHLETVVATPERVAEFLAKLYGGCELTGLDPPLNCHFADDAEDLDEKARRITGLLSAPEEPWSPLGGLVLSIDEPDDLAVLKHTGRIPDRATVEEADGRTLGNLFGLGEGRYQWARLREASARRGDIAWVDELGQAMALASDRHLEIKLTQTFRSIHGGTIYRPVLHRVDFRGERACRFHVLFTEEAKPASIAGSGELGMVFYLLQIGHRFRSEVLESYCGRIRTLAAEHGDDVVFRRLSEVMTLIEAELEQRNMLNPAVLQAHFERQEEKDRMAHLHRRWTGQIRAQLFEALGSKDADAVERLLADLARTSREFIALCGRRYAELAEQEFDETRLPPTNGAAAHAMDRGQGPAPHFD